jgi:DNA-binding transcriptional MerR regulator
VQGLARSCGACYIWQHERPAADSTASCATRRRPTCRRPSWLWRSPSGVGPPSVTIYFGRERLAAFLPLAVRTARRGFVQPLRIGKLARLANVNVQTLRFYEREGLLSKPHRRLSGYREYPPEVVGLVRLIKRIQALGFSLKEVKAVLALGRGPSATIGDAASLLEPVPDAGTRDHPKGHCVSFGLPASTGMRRGGRGRRAGLGHPAQPTVERPQGGPDHCPGRGLCQQAPA